MINKTIQVTKAEFQELANKYWRNEITMKELDQYEIVLQKQPNHENEFINKLITSNCSDHRDGTEKTLYIGNARLLNTNELKVNGFTYVHEWSDGFREVYTNENDRVIVTTCEGDLSINLMDNKASYKKEYERQEEFYNNYA